MTLATRTAFLIEYLWHTTRGDQGHLMPRERVAPHSEVIRAVVLEDSPCCGGVVPGVIRAIVLDGSPCCGVGCPR